MQLIEQHILGRNDPHFVPIDEAAFKSKNLYNFWNYGIYHHRTVVVQRDMIEQIIVVSRK